MIFEDICSELINSLQYSIAKWNLDLSMFFLIIYYYVNIMIDINYQIQFSESTIV